MSNILTKEKKCMCMRGLWVNLRDHPFTLPCEDGIYLINAWHGYCYAEFKREQGFFLHHYYGCYVLDDPKIGEKLEFVLSWRTDRWEPIITEGYYQA